MSVRAKQNIYVLRLEVIVMIDEKKKIVNNSEKVGSTQIDQKKTYTVAILSDPHLMWRRLLAEFLGTFMLVLVAAGAGMRG